MRTIEQYKKNPSKCQECGFCSSTIQCPSPNTCIGCKACYLGCPHDAIECQSIEPPGTIEIQINGESFEVFQNVTIKKALELAGFKISRYPEPGTFFAPCETGGCYSCAVTVDSTLVPACHAPVEPHMQITTELPTNSVPWRIIDGFSPHSVGGVGTPWNLKSNGGFIEVACFAAGCNFRCPTCQNYTVTYYSSGLAMPPEQTAIELTRYRNNYNVNRMAISGGESSLNRPWLIQFFKHLAKLNPDSEARIHLDTNASILTPDYVDELVAAGMTDIGPDIKAVTLETFLKITNITEWDKSLAKKYLETEWNCVKYIADNYYPEQIFMGIGLPYNKIFYPEENQRIEELSQWADRLVQINPEIQVCILDYRPAFRARRTGIEHPSSGEMRDTKRLLEARGLKCVTAQTPKGHLGPND